MYSKYAPLDVIRAEQKTIEKLVEGCGLSQDFASRAYSRYTVGDVTMEQITKLIFDEMKRVNPPAPQPVQPKATLLGTGSPAQRKAGLVSAILNETNPNKYPLSPEGKQFVGRSITEQMEFFLPRNHASNEKAYPYFKRAMASSDFPQALSAVAEKQIQANYSEFPSSSALWCVYKDLKNYKPTDLLKASSLNGLQLRPEGAEIALGSIVDSKEVVSLKDYAVRYQYTDHAMMDDTLGILSQVSLASAQSARDVNDNLSYGILMNNPEMADGFDLFSTEHENLMTGSALDASNYSDALAMLKNQKRPGSNIAMDLSARFLICGPSNEVAARQVLSSVYSGQSNPVQVISSSRISDNSWYVIADPKLVGTVGIFTLQGQIAPLVSIQRNFYNGCYEFKVDYPCEAAPLEYVSMVKNPGV